MRTTLEIDDDVLTALTDLAREQKASLGRVVSDLIRQSLLSAERPVYRNGFRVLQRRDGAARVTNDMVNRMLEEE